MLGVNLLGMFYSINISGGLISNVLNIRAPRDRPAPRYSVVRSGDLDMCEHMERETEALPCLRAYAQPWTSALIADAACSSLPFCSQSCIPLVLWHRRFGCGFADVAAGQGPSPCRATKTGPTHSLVERGRHARWTPTRCGAEVLNTAPPRVLGCLR